MGYTIDTDLATVLPVAPRRVPTVRDMSPDDFRATVRRGGVPVIVEGAMDDWSAIERWQERDHLEALVGGDTRVYCRQVVDGAEAYREDFLPTRFGDFLDEVFVAGTSRNYLTQAVVFEPVGFLRCVAREVYPGFLQALAADCAIPGLVRREEVAEGVLWMGSGGQVTPLHFDPAENLNCTVLGRKRWVLFPPSAARALLVDDADGTDSMLSGLEQLTAGGRWRGGDIDTVYVCETGPGDTLYLPAGYIHHVFSSREPSAALNFWFVELGQWRAYLDYVRYQSIDVHGYRAPLRRALYGTGLLAGLIALRAAYRVSPRLVPAPEITLGAASYARGTAT